MKTEKTEYANFLNIVDAAVHTTPDEIKAKLDEEKRAKQRKKRTKKPASHEDRAKD